MSAVDTGLPEERQTAEHIVRRVPGWGERELGFRQEVVPMASPMYQAVDAEPFRVVDRNNGASLWVKVPDSDAGLFCDPAGASEAAGIAGELGVGPRVYASDPKSGALAMQDLSATHRVATLDRLAEPDIRDAVLAARKKLHAGPRFSRTANVFDDVEKLVTTATEAGAALPPDLSWLLDNARIAAAAISAAGIETVPTHGDGNCSNVLISDAGDVVLVDYDLAANRDPFEDLGSFLAEACPFDPAAMEAFVVFHGSFSEPLFNRARLYGAADDLRWGLIGAVLAVQSRRGHLEFLKYADWRFLRCRMSMRDPRFEERTRRL